MGNEETVPEPRGLTPDIDDLVVRAAAIRGELLSLRDGVGAEVADMVTAAIEGCDEVIRLADMLSDVDGALEPSLVGTLDDIDELVQAIREHLRRPREGGHDGTRDPGPE